ncbi:MAG TPA: hypothetical protein VKY74_20245 [Chloroflexia bacterium]|nr:hypothetical protein [Chloroflexia bacterium]
MLSSEWGEEKERESIELLHSNYYAQGTLTIAEAVGAEIYFWLIVNGLEKGNIWVESTSDDTGICPVPHPNDIADPNELFSWTIKSAAPGQRHCDFLTWYEAWLDAELHELSE